MHQWVFTNIKQHNQQVHGELVNVLWNKDADRSVTHSVSIVGLQFDYAGNHSDRYLKEDELIDPSIRIIYP